MPEASAPDDDAAPGGAVATRMEVGAGGAREQGQGSTFAVALVGVGLACAAGAARRLGDFDLPWHLALGRQMVQERALPTRDALSYTFAGAPLRIEPLSDGLLYLAERAAGTAGLQLVGLLALLALAGLLLLRAAADVDDATASGAPPQRGALASGGPGTPGQRRRSLLAPALVGLALVAAGPWLSVRPALLSLPLLAAELWLIDRYRHRRDGEAGLGSLSALVGVQLLWANTHGSAPLGAALALGHAGHALLCQRLGGDDGSLLPARDGRGAGAAAAAGLAALLCTAASPSGLSLFAEPLRVWGYGQYVTEWTPTTPGFLVNHDPAALALALLTVVALAASLRAGGTRPALFDVAVVVGALALGAARVRLIPLFAVAAAPLCARLLRDRVAGARSLPAAALLLVFLSPPALLATPGARVGRGWDGENLPLGAAEFAAAHHLRGPLWNFLPFGGWIAWRLGPAVRVFIDGRTAKLYPDAFLEEYRLAGRDPAGFAALEQRYGLSWALVRARAGEVFDRPLFEDRRWSMVYLDDAAAIYLREDGVDGRACRGCERYQLLRHLSPPLMLFAQFADPDHPPPAPLLGALDHDAALASRQAPRSLRAAFIAAVAALGHRDQAAARAALARLVALDPDAEPTSLIAQALAERR